MSSNSNIDNSKNTDMLTRSYSDRSNDRNRDTNSNRERDYDGLKQQCDKAMHELVILRRQHGETVRRYDQTRKELEYYRSQNQVMINQIEQAAQESSSLRAKLAVEKQFERSQQDLPEDDTASGDSLNDHFMSYDSRLDNYEALRKGFEDLRTTHSAAVDKMSMMKDEINQLKKQCNELFKERDIALRERDGLKQQCTAAIRQWDLTLRERNDLQEAIQKVQQQHEEAVKEMKAAVAYSVKSSKELKDLNKAHDAAVKEYRLIMSERDSVHNELEKLSEDLSQAYNKNKALENEIKSCREDKKTLQLHVESLKREISSALHDRDKALKECNDYQERFGEITAKNESQREFKSHLDYGFNRERENRNDSREQIVALDLYNSCQKEQMDNLDQANQEIERLRKLADKYHVELEESLQEAEVSKRRRDWAFSERDKIVLERESIRTLCDSLRKQRDDAVSKLARAMRDCDDIMKQKSDTAKELNDLKEKMEAQLEKEAHILQLQATGRYSQDSAIDTDLQDWDTEILNIDLGSLGSNEDLGIDLLGGRDDPLYPNDNAIYISSISKSSIAFRKLRVNDCILRVNSLDCSSISKRLVLETVRSLSSATLVVRRRKPASPSRSLFTTQLQVNNYDHGISLETGIYINKITPGSLAAKDGNLDVGDRILSINNKTVENIKNSREAMLLLHEPGDVLTITTMKSTYCAGNCGSGTNRDNVYKKYTNSTTQTDKTNYSRYQETYQEPQYVQSRRVMLDVPEKPHRNPSPANNSISERDQEDAIAELDSVIDAFRPHPAPTATKLSSRHRKPKNLDKNGGTWPKARSGPVIEHTTGTILHPRKNKERLPLSVLLNNPPSWSPQNNSKSDTSSIDFSVRSGKVGKDVMEYYAKKKIGKYVNSDTESNAGDGPVVRPLSHIYGSPSTNPHHFFTPQYTRYSQPSPSHSGESMLYCFEPPYSHVTQFHHGHSPSVDMHYNRHTTRSPHRIITNIGYRGDDMPESYHGYEIGTFPRKRENPRFRIPSNPSVTSKSSGGAVGISTGSIDRSVSSERDSPMPTFRVEVLNSGQIPMPANKRQSLPDYGWASKYLKKPLLRGVGSGPLPGELRWISIEKSVEPLGIQISCVDSGGVFVSTVSEHSVASKVGLQVGDQLLEVCGINMRSATYQLAANVLRQCGNSITMLVQYSPDKYQELEGAESSTSSRSETPTPCNSPSVNRKSAGASVIAHGMATLTRRKSDRNSENRGIRVYEPRYLIMETRKCSNLGISLVGGNAVGIFVHSVTVNSLAYNAGLRTGDRILEYNGTDLREATAEEAAYELAKPADKVTVLAQYLIDRYNEIKDKPGDSFFIKALFDRTAELGESSINSSQLQFHKDDVLYIDNTMYNGVPGNWRAWLIDHNGYKQQVGIIPSKYKVEEELVVRRNGGELESDARRATRRSFFRRKKHQRSNSKELASFSNINLGWYSSDSGTLHDDSLVIASYQRVIRLNSEPNIRPVMVVGPLADCVTEKLIADFPDLFMKYIPEVKHCSQASMEKGVADSLYIDYRKKGSVYECVSVSGLKEACGKNCHCIIDIGLTSVERLHRHHIYPIVLLIKFKSTKQVKEAKDSRSSHDKISAKAAKEMYEHALKLESEYRHYISAIIPAGVNVAYMCTQIKAAVDLEQSKTLWVPSPTPL
ncbi:disks large homolog 5 [Daktulosphaira vitifoliae]|uniref:disks large homolog 5 n=1 Tax=Daktulosphaira vitifoliae TaxID=58002 RepID=UPI0021A9F4DA|nr:disks large homolog 5 [Daktulosphaira vitifoliae]